MPCSAVKRMFWDGHGARAAGRSRQTKNRLAGRTMGEPCHSSISRRQRHQLLHLQPFVLTRDYQLSRRPASITSPALGQWPGSRLDQSSDAQLGSRLHSKGERLPRLLVYPFAMSWLRQRLPSCAASAPRRTVGRGPWARTARPRVRPSYHFWPGLQLASADRGERRAIAIIMQPIPRGRPSQ